MRALCTLSVCALLGLFSWTVAEGQPPPRGSVPEAGPAGAASPPAAPDPTGSPAGKSAKSAAGKIPVQSGRPRSATRVQIAVFQVRLSHEQAAALDVKQLAAGAQTCQAVQEILAEVGETRLLVRAEQVIDLETESELAIGAQRPFVRGTQVSNSGCVTSQVEYETTGCQVSLVGGWDAQARMRGHAAVDIELSGFYHSVIEIGNGVLAPIFYDVKQHFCGPVVSGRAIALLSVDGGGTAEQAIGHVTWILFEREE